MNSKDAYDMLIEIDDMITQLTAEKQDKIRHEDWSVDELCQESFSCSKCARPTLRRC